MENMSFQFQECVSFLTFLPAIAALGSCRLSEGRIHAPSPGHTAAFGSLLGPASGRTSRLKRCSASFPPPTLQSHPGFNRGILELEPETQADDLSVAFVWEFPAAAVVRTACVHAKGLDSVPGQGTKILQAAHGMAEREKELSV